MIEIRPLKFDLKDVPRHWHGGQKAITAFFDNLSVFFPEGERFFVTTAKRHRHFATDEALKRDVDAFCAQEGHHSREHVRYNQMLTHHGYPTPDMEARIGRLLARVTKYLPPRRHLAATCALEHFTSLLASLVLAHPRVLEGAHPVMADLWAWHAAEENEHKCVAFDLYMASGGTYAERCSVMATTTVIFWSLVFVHQVRMMDADGTLLSPGEWWSLFDFLMLQPNGLPSLLGAYFAFYRRDFHPGEHDTSGLLAKWKAERGQKYAFGA